MPSKRKVRPFTPLQHRAKGQTPLQRAYINRQEQNIHEVQASGSSLSHNTSQRVNLPDSINILEREDKSLDHSPPQGLENIQLDFCGDVTGDITDDPVMIALNQATHDAQHLEGANRWERQYPHMLDAFLQCRQNTSDWGDSSMWDHDFHTPCGCLSTQGYTREVVLVDIMFRTRRKIHFCLCFKSDQVQLIEMGYLGSSPVHPRTAFSLQLLNLHHIMWKYCAVRNNPFARALDAFLDAGSPLILNSQTDRPREWRKTFSIAIKAYRRIITLVREEEIKLLQLNLEEQLASNCPRCFGPPTFNTAPHEPDIVLCIDCNFQQRRHKAASIPIPGWIPKNPELFLPLEEVEEMGRQLSFHTKPGGEDEVVDPCTEQHTAADDVRGKTHWGGNYETGLAGMACCHDHVIRFINIIQSGEKSKYPLSLINWALDATKDRPHNANKLGILYDIGCTIEKGILKQNQFPQEQEQSRLKFGTSCFHAYVHEWSCQLRYNPRMNRGWGMSDGEGLERIWWFLSPLIAALRYATSENRLEMLNLRANHHNELARSEAVLSVQGKLNLVERRMNEAQMTLKDLKDQCGHELSYFSEQWDRQVEVQLDTISETARQKQERLIVLLDLEEQLLEAREKLTKLEFKKRSTRTKQNQHDLLNLPRTLAELELQIQAVAESLGNQEFLELTGISDTRAKPLLGIQVAKSKLYEEKVGVMEAQLHAQLTTGTTNQKRSAELKSKKRKALINKLKTYNQRAQDYNTRFENNTLLPTPSLNEIKGMSITDVFWSGGALTHPDKAWASDVATWTGIQAYLCNRVCEEELQCIAREVRQMLLWALHYQGRVDSVKPVAQEYVVNQGETSKVSALHSGLSRVVCWLWLSWHPGIEHIISRTSRYVVESPEDTDVLLSQWHALIVGCAGEWARLVQEPCLSGTEGEIGEEEELEPDDQNEDREIIDHNW